MMASEDLNSLFDDIWQWLNGILLAISITPIHSLPEEQSKIHVPFIIL
jgi:hypothetical protein